jgi:hypothetical protein
MIQTWHDLAALAAAVFAVIGAILAAQWLYYWPKVMSVVKAAVTEAMGQEHDYVMREVARLDKNREAGDLITSAKIVSLENDLTANISYIRSRIDWLVDCMMKGGNYGGSD